MVEVQIPQIGESITHVFVSRWLKLAGDGVQEGEPILELDSDKASMEVPAPSSGVLVETLVGEGDEVPIGAVVARIDTTAKVTHEAPATGGEVPPEEVRAGPAARQAATEAGVPLSGVDGTGPRGRVTSQDVRRAIPNEAPTSVEEGPLSTARIERVPMSPLRRTIARRLVEAQQTAAMLTTFNEVDLTQVMRLRGRYQESFVARHGTKLGFMSFFVKSTIEALKEFPAVNAEIDGVDILYKRFYNIGVAVSGPKGLVVPVLKHADRMSFAEVELGIKDLAVKAKNNKLGLADFQDGTFTISNGGIFGSMMSTPILNPPQVGILGMHNIVQRPVGIDGRVELRPMMYLALSYDHRIIDGREAVQFLVRIKSLIEDPERMLLEV